MFQIRSPKHEIRNKFECPMTEIQYATRRRRKPCTAATGFAAKRRLAPPSHRTADTTVACRAANLGIPVLIVRIWGLEVLLGFRFPVSVVPNCVVAEVVRLRGVAQRPEFSRIRLQTVAGLPSEFGTTEFRISRSNIGNSLSATKAEGPTPIGRLEACPTSGRLEAYPTFGGLEACPTGYSRHGSRLGRQVIPLA
jgi:hypothetical protein